MGMQQQRAISGNPLMNTAQNNLQATAGGAFLNSNPYVDAMFNQAFRGIAPSINATFGGGNRTGSNAHTQAFAQTASDLATDIYGGNYANERNKQLQAAALGPAFAANDYTDIAQLGGVGAMVEGQAGRQLQDQMNRFNYYQNFPEQKLNQYTATLSGLPGANFGTTTQEGIGGNPLTGAIGGGIAGYGLSQAFPALGPYSLPIAAGGAILGGLFS